MTTTIKASEVKPGMILSIYGGSERFDVERVLTSTEAIQVRDHYEWRGLGIAETVEVLGYFNPEV